jgi:hypothetical protein
LEVWGEVAFQLAPCDVRFRHAGGVGGDGVLAEGDSEAVASEGPTGGVGDGFVDRLIDVVAEHVFEVGLGAEITGGQGGEFALPAAVGDEDVGDGEFAIAVEPPEKAGPVGEWMSGTPAVATIDEADIDEAIVSGFGDIEAVDCAGSVDGSINGGVLIFGINPRRRVSPTSSLLRYST